MVALMGWLFRILFAFLNDPDVKIFGFKICAVHRKHIHRMVPELDGLRYHEQYSSPPCSSTKWPIFFFFFFNYTFHVIGPRWIKKYGTRAHQTRVPQKVVDHYIFSETVFLGKIFQELIVFGHFGPYINVYCGPASILIIILYHVAFDFWLDINVWLYVFSFFNGKRVLLLVLHDMIYIFIMLGLKYSFNEIYS